MAERSRPWNGTVLGDSGPYSDDQWTDTWASLLGPAVASEGVFRRQLNELEVAGAVSPVSVNTGRALVEGTWYENDAAHAEAVPAPPAGPDRMDRIVLQKVFATQMVRIARLAGNPAAFPVPPALTQDGVTWEISLFQVAITPAGVITIYADERDFIGQYEPAKYPREDEVFVSDDFFEPGTPGYVDGEVRRIWKATIGIDGGNGIDTSAAARPGRGVVLFSHGAAAVESVDLTSDNYDPEAIDARLKIIAAEPNTHANLDRFLGYSQVSATLLSAEMVGFINDPAVDANWHSYTRTGGVPTDVDTGVALGVGFKVLEIKSRGTGVVEFWIDGVLVNVHTTNIPVGAGMLLTLKIIGKGGAPVNQVYQYVDMVSMAGDR